MLRRIAKILAVVLAILGLAAFLFRDSRLAAQIRFADNAHVPSVDADFSKLHHVTPPKSAKVTEAYPGLPHNFVDDEAFVRELWNSDNRSIHGYRFYSKPLALSADFKLVIHDLFTAEDTFTPYGGPKMCGGYHADFAVRLEDSGRDSWFLVCLGCHEILCFTEGVELICELKPDAYKKLLDAWRIQELGDGK